MTHYIHDINPILLQIAGPLAIRWYGLSYLLGFVGSIALLRHWSKKNEFDVAEHEVSNFVMLLAVFGVLLGGRLGYMLLYDFNELIANPLSFIRVWEGGMASHGGFVGVILFIYWYAKKHHYSFWNLIDNMAATTSLGIAFGRIANFINGELWGRVTSVSWGVYFPQEANIQYGQASPSAIKQLISKHEIILRHPSQLYQAATEGLLVFFIVLLLRNTTWGKRPGALSASYLLLYALARISMECFREPDAGQPVFFGWLTKGQLYSLLMILGALVIALQKKLFTPNTHYEKTV